jgi:L,D-peptidoglycan transpeptidase YkuD (ErfK/YbiS/YcfS/YnhG family)
MNIFGNSSAMQYQKLFHRRKALLLPLMGMVISALSPSESHAQLGRAVRQVIVTQSATWNSNTATMQCWQRASAGAPWQPVFEKSVPVLLGRKGLAWGRGVFNPPQNGVPAKIEKDWKAPAGVFQLGSLFGYGAAAPGGRWPYIQVGPWDAYVDDSYSPYYNRHVRIDPRQGIPPWFEKQKMRLGDAAYKWMLEIRHNQQPAAPGYGSAIFFHVRRGPDKPSAGCTTMAEADLTRLLRWLDPAASPHYVLLPKADYAALRGPWGLP